MQILTRGWEFWPVGWNTEWVSFCVSFLGSTPYLLDFSNQTLSRIIADLVWIPAPWSEELTFRTIRSEATAVAGTGGQRTNPGEKNRATIFLHLFTSRSPSWTWHLRARLWNWFEVETQWSNFWQVAPIKEVTHVVLRAVKLPVVGTSWEGRGCKTFFLLHCIFPMITQKNISRPYSRNLYHSCTRSRPSRDVASTGLSWTLWPLWKTKWDVSCFTFSCSTHRPPCSVWSLFLRSLGTVRTCSGRRCRGWRVCWRCCGRSSSAPGLSLSSCRPCALSPSVCCSPPSDRPSPFSSDHWRGEGKCRDWELTLKSSVSLWRGSSNLGSCTSSTSARSTLFTICR